jgi:hypothetical protein
VPTTLRIAVVVFAAGTLTVTLAVPGAANAHDASAVQSSAGSPATLAAGPAQAMPVAQPVEQAPRVPADRNQLIAAATVDVAGFGGAFADRDTGTLHVWLTEPAPARAADARDALATLDRAVADLEPVARPADYTFTQLMSWHQAATDLLAMPGVAMSAIDHRENRLLVMVEDLDTVGPAAVRELSGRRVPTGAVSLIEGSFQQQLRLERRPLHGGTQIQFQRGGGTFNCTLGATAARNGVTGFVTNSHCSGVQGGVDGAAYWQAVRPADGSGQVGVEIVDPAMHTGGGCPEGRTCRFSDANFVDASTTIFRSRIARPLTGSVNWNGDDAFRVTDAGFAFVDDTVTKVGRTTGRTAGEVTIICANVNVADSIVTLRCQDIATYNSDPGDSGSPVFEVTHDPTVWDARLVGIHWGGGTVGGDEVAVYSPLPFVQSELLGAIEFCPVGFGC